MGACAVQAIGRTNENDPKGHEGRIRRILHGVWLALILTGSLMVALGLSGVIRAQVGFIVLAIISAVMFVLMVVVDRWPRIPNPVGMPWISLLKTLLKQLRKR